MPVAGRDTAAYVDALLREADARLPELTDPIRTVYIGGGTPSSLPLPELRRLLSYLAAAAPDAEEFTIEVNPENVTEELARLLGDSAVNRVSMGVQSAIDSELKAIGRRHSWKDVCRAVSLLRQDGIRNLSLDLIFGLPGQTLESWRQSIDSVLSLSPEHLSAYSLMLEPGTRLSAMIAAGKVAPLPQELSADMYDILCQRACEAGFLHYEISNFALPGRHSRHNSSYWDFTPYIGLGAAAHSYNGRSLRRANPANLRRYLADPLTPAETESLTPEQQIEEFIMLSLRRAEGLDLDAFLRRFGSAAHSRLLRQAQPLLAASRLLRSSSRLLIPEKYWLVADPIIIDLLPA